MQRYFSKQLKDDYFTLCTDDLYHISVVMRMKNKDNIHVVYEDELYLCEVIDDKAKVITKLETNNIITKEVSLIIPLLKENKFDLILQKSTELGVSSIIPIVLSRSIIKMDESRLDKKMIRWNKILKEASEQSHRLDIPKLVKPIDVNSIDKFEGLNLVCSTLKKENTIKKVLKKNVNYDKINILVGPEGGLSLDEENLIVDKGFIPVTLGNNILRVETVPLFLLSVINYENME